MTERNVDTPSGEAARPCRRKHVRHKSTLRAVLNSFVGQDDYGKRHDDPYGFWARRHQSRWLYVALAILVLCAADAILTLNILLHGGYEVNSVMAVLIETDIQLFAIAKIALTGAAVVVLVANHKYHFFRGLNIGHILKAVLVGYLLLIVYEVFLLRHLLFN